MNKEIYCITSERKTANNKFKNDNSDFLGDLYSILKKLGHLFFHTYLLTCLKEDPSVMLKSINIKQVNKLSIKTMVLTF